MDNRSEDQDLRLGFARELMDAEALSLGGDASRIEAGQSVLSRLYEILRPVVGAGGYETILLRALVIAARNESRLGGIDLPKAGAPSVQELTAALGRDSGRSAVEAVESIIAEFMSFLARLVGWPLTMVFLREAWPAVVATHDAEELEQSTHSGSLWGEG